MLQQACVESDVDDAAKRPTTDNAASACTCGPLFRIYVGLFCRYTGLFCGYIGLSCKYEGLVLGGAVLMVQSRG